MIKYIGSKRLLTPLIQRVAAMLPVRTACDLFAGTTRVGQALREAGIEVLSNDTASYSEVFGHAYIEAGGDLDRDQIRETIAHLGSAAAPARVRDTRVLRAGALLPSGQRDADRRHPRGDRPPGARPPRALGGADQPDRGCRPGRLDRRAADGLPQAVGAARPPAAGAARAASRSRTGRPSGATRRQRARRSAGRHRPRLPRPALQPALLLPQLPRLGDARPQRPARALRRGVQAAGRA